jgi:hypothetical protein
VPPAFIHTGRFPGWGGPPIVNRAHPLARMLQAAYYPGAFPNVPITNLVSPGNGDIVTQGGTATPLVATPEGLGINIAGTGTTTRYINGPCPSSLLNGRVTLFVRAQWKPGQASNSQLARIFGIWYNSPQTSPYYVYTIGVDNGTQSQNVGLAWAYSSSAFLYVPIGTMPALTVGQMVSGAGVFYGSPTVKASPSALLYQNGTSASYGTLEYAGFAGSNPQIGFGDSNSSRNAACIPTVAYAWNRTLPTTALQYLDANPYALLLWPSDRGSLALATLTGSGTAVRADAILAAEYLESLLSDSAVPLELLASGSAITENATLPLEFSATVLRDWGAGAAQSIIRRFSRPALVARVRRLFFPGRLGTLALESERRQHADPGAPIESLGSAGNSVAGDAISPIETLSSQRSELGAAIENTASLQVHRGAPVETLAGGITTITDANLVIEWVTAAPSILVSLESGPERVRLLATRGRVRLLRRK